ncbi:MAG TPA: DNA polymerase Y family protein [Longimicrobiaceae bacterium]|nr:DNA polymerase Y family protein [Longimicrobiaceae bacterium]
MPGPRIACIHLPLFPLAARLRSEPELVREAVVVTEGNGNAARVVAGTRLAREAGVKPGHTLPQARALCPKLVARTRDEECERTAQEALLEVAEAFSPRVEDAREGVAYVDVEGLERHFKSPSPELELGRSLVAAADKAGLPVRVGIASSKLAARVAAGLPDSPVIVPDGEEAAFLAPLPLARLAPEVEIASTLEQWGVRSIGDFARLPKERVASRLGRTGRELHATARGMDSRPLIPRELPPVFNEGMNLEWPLVSLEPFLFVGRAALERLCERLESAGLACQRLGLELRLEPDGHQTRTIDMPAPTRDVKTLLTLMKLNLEETPPGAPVAGFTFLAWPDRPREAQLSLYGPAALSPDKLATTLARLFALLGPDRVGSPRPVDGHRPERFSLVEYTPPPPPEVRREPRAGRGLLAVRVLRPPLSLEVISEDQQPVEVRTLVQDESEKRPRVEGRVKVASGPWGLEEGWWTEEPTGRDYWDVELTGGIYRIYRDRATGEWFADGIYD